MVFEEAAGEALFRANPRYTLTALDRLDAADLRSALECGLDPSDYGVFIPAAGSRLHVRSACADTALLVLSLQSPARIPQYLRRQDPAGWIGQVKKLLLDEILEIRVDGEYLAGAAFLAKEPARPDRTDGDLLSSLSSRALLHAEKLDVSDPRALAGRLYCFNRLPFCPDAHGGLSGTNRIAAYLKLAELEREPSFKRRWRRLSGSPVFSGWLNFASKSPDRLTRAGGKWTCKLYISAHWTHLPQVLRRFLSNRNSHECATGFKVPCDVFGLLRPDNFVVYLRSKDALHELAEALGPALQGVRVQGVPFTAPLSKDGLLSWGADPPKASDYGRGGESWRSWLVDRLAADMARAKTGAASASLSPRAFALERLRLEGVDVDSWAPPAYVL
jgi:hypothetical protein